MARTRLFQLFSYTAAAAASIICILHMQYGGHNQRFVGVSLLAIAFYAVLGLLKTVTCNETLEDLHCHSIAALPFITLPFLATEVWLKHGVLPKEVAYAHAGTGVIIAMITMLSCGGRDVTDFVVLANALSIAYVGYYKMNVYALYAAGIFVVAHFTGSRCGRSEIESFYDYFLAAYSYFSMMAVIT